VHRHFILFPVVLAAFLALLPARAQNASADADNPHYKQAQQDLDNGDANAAADEYEAALAADPKLADAHYELGVLYAEKLSEPIAALYHLDRFLKLAPNSANAPAARDLVTTESEAFAASLPGTSTSAALARLELENAGLKKQAADAGHTIEALQAQLAEASARTAAPPEPPTGAPPPATGVPPALPGVVGTTAPAPGTAIVPSPVSGTNALATAAPDAGGVKTYTVKSGDSLWKIAHKMYPHNTTDGEEKIKDANKDAFSGKFLKPGQVLVIPE
jgi:tetratricopeptide (TPR) repeat protein